MSGFHKWQGYLVKSEANNYYAYSTWKSNNSCVFGFDSDYTTIAIALLRYLMNDGIEIALSEIDDKISTPILLASTSVKQSEEGLILSCNDDASITIYSDEKALVNPPISFMNNLDQSKLTAVSNAWKEELHEKNISQGAYISGQQYDESLETRLSLIAQDDGKPIWPQRQMNAEGEAISNEGKRMEPKGKITSWTKLSAAGAPSEFAIRAPVLGGISTVMVETTDGPNGVFLLVDDEINNPQIGQSVELVVRRLYAQEGVMRYGVKAILEN
ncbi:MAG: hypothetical protein VX043_01565 [Candidatus Thermoplasmatota archaeon]|nr:hypothetical protein [Candidatus Thermoplasmatota archaeon]